MFPIKVISSENDYRIGFNHGYREAQRGLANRFERRPHGGRRQRERQISDYEEEEPEEYDSVYDYERKRDSEGKNRKNYVNYGNLFAVDEHVLSKNFAGMSENCRGKIKPDFGTCIERAANKFDVNIKSESFLGENDCKALWDLMCCSENLILKHCASIDLKLIQVGFTGIQKTLEIKGCAKSPRSTVQCSIKNFIKEDTENDYLI